MASKKRKKSRQESRLASGETQVRRSAEVRALFNDAALPAKGTEDRSPEEQTHTPTLKTATVPTLTPTAGPAKRSTAAPAVSYEPSPAKPREPLRTVIAQKPYTPAKRVDLGARERDKKTAWWLGPSLICAALLMLGLGWLHIQRSNVVSQPVGHRSETLESLTREARKKVAFYQKQLGHRLNTERINVEIMNARVAPTLDASVVPRVDSSMMRGVPLMQENYAEQNYGSRSKIDPVPSDHPDARIQYGLQEEQHREEFDRRAQQEYIKEFVENARRDGVRVTLDQDANVVKVEPLSGFGGSGIDAGVNETRRPGSYESGLAQ